MLRRSGCLIKARYHRYFLAFYFFTFLKWLPFVSEFFRALPFGKGIVGVWDPFVTDHTWTGIVMWRAGSAGPKSVELTLQRMGYGGGRSEGSTSRVRRSISKEGICYWDWNARSRLAAPSSKLNSIQYEPPLLSLSPRRRIHAGHGFRY